jgi:hypothetical protein
MKTIVIIIAIAAFLWVCVSMARDKRDAKVLPVVTNGLTYSIDRDKFEPGLDRYEVGVRLNQDASEKDALAIGEWIRKNRDKSDNFMIFFYVPTQVGVWGRVDYPEGKFEIVPNFEM